MKGNSEGRGYRGSREQKPNHPLLSQVKNEHLGVLVARVDETHLSTRLTSLDEETVPFAQVKFVVDVDPRSLGRGVGWGCVVPGRLDLARRKASKRGSGFVPRKWERKNGEGDERRGRRPFGACRP